MKGTIYNFFPVTVNENDDECDAIDCWQWAYFGWLFEFITYCRILVAILFNMEQAPFLIKIKK